MITNINKAKVKDIKNSVTRRPGLIVPYFSDDDDDDDDL